MYSVSPSNIHRNLHRLPLLPQILCYIFLFLIVFFWFSIYLPPPPSLQSLQIISALASSTTDKSCFDSENLGKVGSGGKSCFDSEVFFCKKKR